MFSYDTDFIKELIESFYDKESVSYIPALSLARHFNNFIGEDIFEDVDGDLYELKEKFSPSDEEYDLEYDV